MLKTCYRCNSLHPVGQRCPQQRNGSTRTWRKQRHRILARDGYTCTECGAPAEHVDHITPHAMGGSDDDTQLQALCQRCNLRKGNA